ncbi:serpentine type 7TM GPCR chemoreceptor srt domain-containing protein [Ditylenchus destructor]|uniref:Serpentine type 7TM GPCR chemoreceptor srt domain-containing protein n=1 Tax=Ditylenchus destructor TaxID=166010 RepID=A0AAD4MM56_9BILA|nr:serpentine type 7TM GPCR chemoreceptor srt domain-containing protein [Ditylenchus destructor]
MNTFFFHRDEFNYYYNCSLYDVDFVPVEKRRRIGFGIVYISLFVFLELLYAPVLYVLFTSKKFASSSYRIMLLLGIVDSLEIVVVGLFTGYLAITGTVYCSNQLLSHICGSFGTGLWFMEEYIALLLAFNRCTVMYSSKLANTLFNSNHRVYYWMAGAVGMGLLQSWFVNPTMYNPISGFYLFNPHFGYINYIEYFDGMIDIILQGSLNLAFVAIYVIFGLLLWVQRRSQSGELRRISRSDRNIFLQVFTISVLVVIVGIGLIYMQIGAEKEAYSLVVSVLMPTYLGCPAMIYLTANKTMRSEILTKLKLGHFGAIAPWRSTSHSSHVIDGTVTHKRNPTSTGRTE